MPARIIFYRDGVGDAQIDFVMKGEVEVMKKVLNGMCRDEGEVKFVYVAVNKRINT